MSYVNKNHRSFVDRQINWMKQMQELREEAERLDEIFVNEADGNADRTAAAATANATFDDNQQITKAELLTGIDFMRTTIFGHVQDDFGTPRVSNRAEQMTPFLQE